MGQTSICGLKTLPETEIEEKFHVCTHAVESPTQKVLKQITLDSTLAPRQRLSMRKKGNNTHSKTGRNLGVLKLHNSYGTVDELSNFSWPWVSTA